MDIKFSASFRTPPLPWRTLMLPFKLLPRSWRWENFDEKGDDCWSDLFQNSEAFPMHYPWDPWKNGIFTYMDSWFFNGKYRGNIPFFSWKRHDGFLGYDLKKTGYDHPGKKDFRVDRSPECTMKHEGALGPQYMGEITPQKMKETWWTPWQAKSQQ